ncbi:Gfo/Idh/MocA family oxidoreductase [uncultured Brachyspira sp.]|uniref:Gfo/Idh/MocA family protein n=1 Tax=uncultured Brachyspira sp. TaxID=221953 RepID=UPI002584F3CF|nr:Gfo/Idh/MocA family oxidoreductase [uncultured Brachyspira sp.]
MVAIIGGGFISNIHAQCYKNLGVKIEAMADISEKVRQEFKEKYNCKTYSSAEEMLKDISDNIDIVDICAPTYLHEELILLALKYNKHIICEKPLSINLNSVDNIISKLKSSDRYLMVAQVLRFWTEYVRIKEWFEDGVFGDIKLVSAMRLAQHPKSEWFYNPQKSGGGIFELHIHDIDFLCYLFGDVKEVYANGSKDENESWDFINSSIKFKNGISASAQGIFGITDNYPFTANMKVIGDKATAEYSLSAGVNLDSDGKQSNSLILYRKGKEPIIENIKSKDAYELELEYFIDCVKNNKKPEIVSLDSIKRTIKTINFLIESLESGNIVKFN